MFASLAITSTDDRAALGEVCNGSDTLARRVRLDDDKLFDLWKEGVVV